MREGRGGAQPLILLSFLLLAAHNNGGWLRYAANAPSAFTWGSARWIVAQDLVPIAAAALLGALFWGLGARLSRRLLGSPGFHPGYAFALGLGVFSTCLFLLGLLRCLRGWSLFALIAAGACLAWPQRRLPAFAPRNGDGRPPVWKALCRVALLCSAWHVLVLALAPPTEWDVLAYHLALPKLYLAQGGIREIPWLVHSHWPHLMEALYTLPLALGRDNLAALLHAGAWGALVYAAFVEARRRWGESAWCAAALLAAQPVPLRFAGTAHSDGAWALFYFLSAMSAWNWASSGSRAWLVLGGVLGGFCVSAKLPGLALLAWLAIWILARGRAGLRAAGLFSLCACCVFLPWLLKTWLATGNPVWPFLPGFLGGRFSPEAVAAAHFRSEGWAWLRDGRVLREGPQFLLVPALILGGGALRRRGSSFPDLLKFLWLPVVPFLALVAHRDSAWRYLWPFYPAFALTAAWGFSRLSEASGCARAAAFAALGFGLWPALRASQNNQLFPVSGLRSALQPGADPRSAYLARTLDMYRFCERVNREHPRARLLLFREIRGYYLDTEYVWGDPTNQGLIQYAKMSDGGALGQALGRLGITHVWVNEGLGMYRVSPGYYTQRTMELMAQLLGPRAPVLKDGENFLYEL